MTARSLAWRRPWSHAVVVVTSVTSVALTGGACGGASTDTGGLMLLIRSDMTVGTDFDSIRVEVAAGSNVLNDATFTVGPKGYALPVSLALIPGESATPVSLRVTARQAGRLRVFWQARTVVPRSRVAVLPADLLWACEGRATESADGVQSSCGGGLACIDGTCSSPDIDSGALATYDPGAETLASGGECSSGSRDCEGTQPRICSKGRWSKVVAACSGAAPVCRDGGCVGAPSVQGSDDATCATLTGGDTWCWGANTGGRLGDGTTTPRSGAVRIKSSRKHVQVGVGRTQACALGADGIVDCWGGGNATPTPVPGIAGAAHLAVGYDHQCVVTASGAVFCWGDNSRGQSAAGASGATTVLQPIQISALPHAVQVATGYAHSCALLTSGKVRCWGIGGSGEIGDGSTQDRVSPDVDVRNLSDAIEIRSGFFSTCARTRDDAALCWGRLPLGNGTAMNSAVAVPTWTGVRGLGGTLNDGGCVLRGDGAVGCWAAKNLYGELGNGTPLVPSLVPKLVSGVSGAVAVGVGRTHACAVLADDSVSCWGSNASGKLGDGTTVDRPLPVKVVFN